MTKYLKIVACTAVVMAFASPASAKVINLYDLRNFLYPGSTCMGKGCKGTGVYECNAQDFTYSAKPAGMDCDLNTFDGGTKCYSNCRCSESQFPFTSDCGGTNFVAPTADSAKCTDRTGTYYASCSCASGMLESISGDYLTYFNTDEASATLSSRSSKTLTCYDRSKFTCKSAYRELPRSEVDAVDEITVTDAVVQSLVEPVNYSVATNLPIVANQGSSRLKMCVKGVAGLSDVVMASAPTATKCAEYTSAAAKHYPSKVYYYYTGNCNSTGLCRTTTQDCVNYSSETFDTYNISTNTTGNGSCRFITGCQTTGWNGSHFCTWSEAGTANVPTGLKYTVVSDDSGAHPDCIKVTGCDTNAGYTKVGHGSAVDGTSLTTSLESSKEDDTTVYDVALVSNLVDEDNDLHDYIMCRMAKGCKTTNSSGLALCDMNTAWGGWLKCMQ